MVRRLWLMLPSSFTREHTCTANYSQTRPTLLVEKEITRHADLCDSISGFLKSVVELTVVEQTCTSEIADKICERAQQYSWITSSGCESGPFWGYLYIILCTLYCSIITNGWGESKPIAFGPIFVTDSGSLQLRDVILEANGFVKVLEARTLKGKTHWKLNSKVFDIPVMLINMYVILL